MGDENILSGGRVRKKFVKVPPRKSDGGNRGSLIDSFIY
jgi:hypothetical protein